jgi:hypothetical protein
MRDLQNLEVFEIEVLDLLNSIRVLDSLFFGGGTMLRLCHNLNRYSTDLDFWISPSTDAKQLHAKIKSTLQKNYRLSDAANKKYTILYEFRSEKVTRNLKIEIRKEQSEFEWERKIAFSRYADKQVLVKGLTLKQMMRNKTEALLSRKLIRDCFDLEFLLMRGIELTNDKEKLTEISEIIKNFKDRDYKVILGSILEVKERKFYSQNKFSFLREEITRKLLPSKE